MPASIPNTFFELWTAFHQEKWNAVDLHFPSLAGERALLHEFDLSGPNVDLPRLAEALDAPLAAGKALGPFPPWKNPERWEKTRRQLPCEDAAVWTALHGFLPCVRVGIALRQKDAAALLDLLIHALNCWPQPEPHPPALAVLPPVEDFDAVSVLQKTLAEFAANGWNTAEPGDLILRLLGAELPAERAVTLRVLGYEAPREGSPASGFTGKLTLEWLPGEVGSQEVHWRRHPASLLLPVDKAFQDTMTTAMTWATNQPRAPRGGTVRWWLRREPESLGSAADRSAGGALAAGLMLLWEEGGGGWRAPSGRTAEVAITATVDGDGNLGKVGGIPHKLAAAAGARAAFLDPIGLVILPKEGGPRGLRSTPEVTIREVATVEAAVQLILEWIALPVTGTAPARISASRVPSGDTAWLSIPRRRWNGTPGALLRADFAIVPFHGREQELARLKNWVLGDADFGARVLTGSGGMGKSRLAQELCLQLRGEGVRSGFLNPDAMDALLADLNAGGPQRTLVVIDYAETRDTLVARLLRAAARSELTSLRVLLLARGAGQWWRTLKGTGEGVGDWLANEPEGLKPLALDVAGRLNSYHLARRAFSEKLGQQSDTGDPDEPGARYYERTLLLHMSALLAIQGIRAQGMDRILALILDREVAFWASQLRSRGLPQFLEQGFERAMGIISAYGGVRDRTEAIEVISQIRFFRGQPPAVIEAVADILHASYPGPPWIEPIQPDLLLEFLVVRATLADPEDFTNLVL